MSCTDLVVLFFVFFFKQKTAYEMRISDWSSDVCSSDLHRRGVEAVRRVVEAAPDLGIEVLTLYAFSSENWKRPADEVSDLMGLLHEYLRKEIAELHAKGVRLSVIGDYRRLSPDLVSLIEHGMEMTRGNARLNLVLALNYGAQDEIVRATRAIAAAARAGQNGRAHG